MSGWILTVKTSNNLECPKIAHLVQPPTQIKSSARIFI